jgi:ribosomal protein S18 acetylase RimI-like enzyme
MREQATGSVVTGPKAEETPEWWVRDATPDDLGEVASALASLLTELSGSSPSHEDLQDAAATVLADPEGGCLLVAQTAHDGLVGILAASFQHAIHVPGRYCVLQDLWVSPRLRGQRVGAALVDALTEHVHRRDIDRVEVGLPPERFAGITATQAFYEANGFTLLGPRMRKVLR